MDTRPSRTCSQCGGHKDFYAIVCKNCKDWVVTNQPGPPGTRKKRAAEVARLLDDGLSLTAIAAQLGISRKYVSMLRDDPSGEADLARKRAAPKRPRPYKSTPAALARGRRQYAKHREKHLAYTTQWQKDNAEKYKAYQRAYREANREKARLVTREWAKDNPGRVRQNSEKRRALMLGAPEVERIDRQAIIERDRSICHICRKKVKPKDMSLDHLVPLSKGGSHTAANLAVAHRSCNSRRHAGRLPAQLRLIG